jgi:hypothetical protein
MTKIPTIVLAVEAENVVTILHNTCCFSVFLLVVFLAQFSSFGHKKCDSVTLVAFP